MSKIAGEQVKTLVAGFSIVGILGLFTAFSLFSDPQNGLQ